MAVRMIESTLSDGVCVLRLSAPPANTITFPLLDELRAAIRRANAQDEIRGIVLTGRPDHFSAGADVGLFRDLVRPEEAVRTSRVFQEAMQIVEDSAKPVAAAVAGRVMGSALELAAACHYRVCTRATRFSMPEVTLGINPGAGGTQRLPRLVGVDEALKMLLTGEAVSAERGRAIGLVDAISEGDDLLDVARTVLRSAPGQDQCVRRQGVRRRRQRGRLRAGAAAHSRHAAGNHRAAGHHGGGPGRPGGVF
jgi:enoyl-CoA hydratase/carnithine racemase